MPKVANGLPFFIATSASIQLLLHKQLANISISRQFSRQQAFKEVEEEGISAIQTIFFINKF